MLHWAFECKSIMHLIPHTPTHTQKLLNNIYMPSWVKWYLPVIQAIGILISGLSVGYIIIPYHKEFEYEFSVITTSSLWIY